MKTHKLQILFLVILLTLGLTGAALAQQAPGTITTIAGTGTEGFSGDGGRAPRDRGTGDRLGREGGLRRGVPLSCRKTCPDLAPCRRDAGRLSWLQRAGPSATLDKELFGCGRILRLDRVAVNCRNRSATW